MSTSFLEIVELPDGRIALRRAEDEEALVTLDFSADAKAFLQGQHIEVAKAMFNLGVEMAGSMVDGDFAKRGSLAIQLKDLRNALHTSAGLGFDAPIARID